MNIETTRSRKPGVRPSLRRCEKNTQWGDARGRPRWRSSFLGDPGAKFFWELTEKAHRRSRGGGKVKIPRRLRDFQVPWESPVFGLFHGTAFSTALLPTEDTEP